MVKFQRTVGMALWPALWLWLAGCSTPAPETAPPVAAQASPFADVSAAVGLDFNYVNGMSGQLYFVEMTGAGGALFDYDNDGDLDLYAVQGHPLGTDADSSDLARYLDRLYRNDLVETGTLHFTDVTEASRLRATGYGMGVTTGDVDNDGYTDLYVTNWGANQLWRNNGDGTFSDVTQPGVTDDPRWSTGASFLDFDRDGWLDLMVVNYDAYTLQNDHPCYAPSGRRDYCGPDAYAHEPDRLLRNRGDGTFEDVTLPMGLSDAFGPGLGVVAADFNGDGWPDLYVANDGKENQLWINQGGRRFENQAVMAGAAVNAAGKAEASMGVAAEDFDDDGDEDLFMTHLSTETNTFYANLGGGLFEDRSRATGLALPSKVFTGFGVAPLDYDNDGRLDLFVTNGEVKLIAEQAEAGLPLPLRQTNQLFRNLGQGRFEETTPDDAVFARAQVGRGVAAGDLDNDGDTDVVVFNNEGPLRVLRNEVGQARRWVGLRLTGVGGREMLGARVALLRGGEPVRWRRVHSDGSYASASDARVLFGLGDEPEAVGVRVYWPGGRVEQWNDVAAGRYHTLVEGQGKPVETP